MSKSKANKRSATEYRDPDAGPVFSVRFGIALLLMAVGLGWLIYYYLVARVDPTAVPAPASSGPAFMNDLGRWNYAVGFGLLLVGLAVSAHPATPMGRGRGVVAGMLGCFLFGLFWIVTFYVFADNITAVPVMNDLENYNLVVGIGFMAVGFSFATRWE